MTDKEATKKMHKAGVNRNIVILKSNTDGYYCIKDTRFLYQISTPLRRSPEECIEDWKNGKRPKERGLGELGESEGLILR